jgi:uncharacterized protein
MRQKTRMGTIVAVIAVLILMASGVQAQAPTEVSMTSYGVGSQAYVFSAGIAEGVQKVSGIRTRVVPAGNDIGLFLPLQSGEVDFAIFTGGTGWFVSHGAGDFAGADFGPQKVRMAWRGGNLYVGFFTRGNAGFETLSDLKGRRVVQIPGSTTINNLNTGALAFGGLTLADVRVVNMPSHGAAGKAITDGAADMHNFGTTGSRPMETAASPHGIHWFNMDINDTEAWDRFYRWAPWTTAALVTRYAGEEKGIKPFYATTYPYNIWTMDATPVDTVYHYAKAIWDGYDDYKDRHAELPEWNHENMANFTGCYYPYHEGAVRLLKEKGKWTAEHEAFQKTQLENEEKRLALWEKAKQEAGTKKITIGSDEWKDFFWNKLIEAGLLQ